MIVYPNAKINLGLQVTDRREDGFHSIDSVFCPVKWKDILEIIPSATKSEYSFSGLAVPGNAEDNLCVKAYHLLKSEYHLPEIKMHLHKIIPMGAGLGGGSADGAFALKLLNDLFQLHVPAEKLTALAGKLGSDCMFFIRNQPAYVTGRGEVMEKINIDLSKYKILLVHPGFHISTAEAYAAIQISKKQKTTKEIVLHLPVSEWKNELHNDFETVAFAKHPEIKKIKEKMYDSGALYSSMTGSGSAVYGIFEKMEEDAILSIAGNNQFKIS
ncbi:MAG: 4-(cytidine 5'-diphospho)-2-C-methyl-D-erythritol kinase [Bacteroidota bacterium]